MSATERAVIYVDSGSDLSSMASVSSVSSSKSVSPVSASRRGPNAIISHQELVKSSKSSGSSSNGSSGGNNFVIKIQIGEESTLFNPVRIDVATKNGHLHRIQHHHVTSTNSAGMGTSGGGSGKSILIAAAAASASPGSTSPDDDLSPANSSNSNSGQSSPRSDMTPPPLGKGATKRILLGGSNLNQLRFGSETSESETESDISSLTDYQIGRQFNKNGGKAASIAGVGGKLNQLQAVPSSSCPAAQYVMREILGMSLADASLDNKKKTKLIEEQNKFVQLKNDVHKSLMKSFSSQEHNLKLSGLSNKAAHGNGNRKETFSDEIKKVVQQRLNRNQTRAAAEALPAAKTKSGGFGFGTEIKEVAEEKRSTGSKGKNHDIEKDDGSMLDVMKMVTANNKIISFTSSDSSCPIILDQNYFHLNEMKEFNSRGKEKKLTQAKTTKAVAVNAPDVNGSEQPTSNRSSDSNSNVETLSRHFAGYKDIFARTTKESQNQIMSDNGTIRGVKNRVRDGIATFLQTKDTKNYNEREKGRLVVYVTSMGVVRDTFQRCQKVKQILRTLLVKFDERDCYMNRSIQDEIRERLQHQNNNNLIVAAASSSATSTSSSTQNGKKKLAEISSGFGGFSSPSSSPLQKQLLKKNTKSSTNIAGAASFCTNSCTASSNVNHSNNHHNSHNKNNLPINFISLPQVFLEGQHLGDADAIEKLNETGQLRDLLRPFKSLSVLTTCDTCGGFRMLPCPICNGSKKSVHRNHFTTEFVALKCMHCDPAGLVRCEACNAPDECGKGKGTA